MNKKMVLEIKTDGTGMGSNVFIDGVEIGVVAIDIKMTHIDDKGIVYDSELQLRVDDIGRCSGLFATKIIDMEKDNAGR